jgi:hypothetical protein
MKKIEALLTMLSDMGKQKKQNMHTYDVWYRGSVN